MGKCGQYRGGQCIIINSIRCVLQCFWIFTDMNVRNFHFDDSPKNHRFVVFRKWCWMHTSNSLRSSLNRMLNNIISFHFIDFDLRVRTLLKMRWTDRRHTKCVRAAKKPSLIFNQWWIKQQFYFQTEKTAHKHRQTLCHFLQSEFFLPFIVEARKKKREIERDRNESAIHSTS